MPRIGKNDDMNDADIGGGVSFGVIRRSGLSLSLSLLLALIAGRNERQAIFVMSRDRSRKIESESTHTCMYVSECVYRFT